LIAVLVTVVAVAATVSALAIGHRGPRPGGATPTTLRPTTTTLTPTGSTAVRAKLPPPTIVPTTTSDPATTATTVVGRVDSLLYINGINQTASDVSYIIIASCVAGTPSSIEVRVSSLVSKTPTGSIDWQLDDESAQLLPLTGGSVTIPYLCVLRPCHQAAACR